MSDFKVNTKSIQVNEKQLLRELKKAHPELVEYSDEQIISIYNEQIQNGQLNTNKNVSVWGLSKATNNNEGLALEHSNTQPKIPKELENKLKDTLSKRVKKVSEDTSKAESENSFVGKIWSWSKNNIPLLDKITDSSNEVREQQKLELEALKNKDLATAFKEITGLDYTEENVSNFLNDKEGKVKTLSEQALDEYKVGQEDSADFVSDMVSGGLSVAIYSGAIAAVVAVGAPFALAAGVAIGTTALIGAGTKIAVKKADAMAGNKEYEANGRDALLGAVNGVLAPITAGFGGKIASTAIGKFGGTVLKEGTEEVVEKGVGQFFKEAMINPAGNVYQGSLKAKIVGYGTEMGVDGGLGGAGDAMTRTAYDGGSTEDILEAGLGGAIGGSIAAIGLGGAMKGLSNATHKAGTELGNKVNPKTPEVKPDTPEIKAETVTSKTETKEIKTKDDAETKVSDNIKTQVTNNKQRRNVSSIDKFIESCQTYKNIVKEVLKQDCDIFTKLDFLTRIINRNTKDTEWVLNNIDGPLVEKTDFLTVINKDNRKFVEWVKTQEGNLWDKVNFLHAIRKDNKKYIEWVQSQEGTLKDKAKFLDAIRDDNKEYIEWVQSQEGSLEDKAGFLRAIKENNKEHIEWVKTQEGNLWQKVSFLKAIREDNKDFVELIKTQEGNLEQKSLLIQVIREDNKDFVKWLMTQDANLGEKAQCILAINKDNKKYVKWIMTQDGTFFEKTALIYAITKDNKEYVEWLIKQEGTLSEKSYFLNLISEDNKEYIEWIKVQEGTLDEKADFLNAISKNTKEDIEWVKVQEGTLDEKAAFLSVINDDNKEFIELVKKLEGTLGEKARFLFAINDDNKEFIELVKKLEGTLGEKARFLFAIENGNKEYAKNLLQNYSKMEIQPNRLPLLLENYGKISPKQLQNLNHIMGRKEVSKLSDSDVLIATQMVDIYGKTNINEIPQDGKKSLLRNLVDCNEGLFNISDDLRKHFPLIPTNREDYCSLLPSIVRSIGIETNVLKPKQIEHFNKSMGDLSTSLAKVTDTEFTNMSITQEYSKNDFIKKTLEIVKDMNPKERQKVYDYFGFELHHNKKGNPETGFSITGYPVNLNNGKKLAQITDPKTKEIVEKLRPEVIRFSQNNHIKCDNPKVEQLLNDVVEVLPEVRTMIGKVQHGTHEFDVMQHSLKVMQKVAQDPKFEKLNESDKKITLLASLLHDIKKAEGMTDKTHAVQGGFDISFIARKFDLPREDLIKLYTLSRHHEWLEFVNTAKTEEQLTKRLQSVAYDLQYDNLFEMAQIFTHADLKAVKKDNTFHDTTIGDSRASFDKDGNRVFETDKGTKVSHGEAVDRYSKRINEYIQELKKSQPLLPVTQIPKASRINEAITVVHPDGSTNIKGVYKNPEGLVVIKFNEVEDWEAIGFPKGSVSRGIEAKGGSTTGRQEFLEDVNTGNIKFFAHGLDFENQLAKFDAFSLIDSDVLLSISYAERPESKFRFFRTQGVLLDFDTKYIHGGGNTDSGSGCGKFIEQFKREYIFGGERESDRVYVSNLIKEATGMNDTEYIRFVEKNKNKSIVEIEPKEVQEVLVKAYASINSNTRKGARSYNEIYGSNPTEVMATFAYSEDYKNNFGHPFNVLQRENTKFLQKYSLEHNIPMIVFGD